MATPANKLSVRSNAGKGSAKSPKPVVERVACSVVEHATRSVPPTIALTTPFIKLEAPNGARASHTAPRCNPSGASSDAHDFFERRSSIASAGSVLGASPEACPNTARCTTSPWSIVTACFASIGFKHTGQTGSLCSCTSSGSARFTIGVLVRTYQGKLWMNARRRSASRLGHVQRSPRFTRQLFGADNVNLGPALLGGAVADDWLRPFWGKAYRVPSSSKKSCTALISSIRFFSRISV